jgi:hypothetical protein
LEQKIKRSILCSNDKIEDYICEVFYVPAGSAGGVDDAAVGGGAGVGVGAAAATGALLGRKAVIVTYNTNSLPI